MSTAHYGMSAASITANWRKSSHSGAVGNCVELAPLAGNETAVRNSRNPCGPALVYSGVDMSAFLARVKDGDFDGVHH
jgi:hypothetical protein